MVIPPARRPLRLSPLVWHSVQAVFLSGARHLPRAPLPVEGVTSSGAGSSPALAGLTRPSSLVLTHAPHRNPLVDLGFRPIQRVFAGCCVPLLRIAGSRRYLHNPCIGAWPLTPPRFLSAFTRFFLRNIGFTSEVTRSARESSSLQCNFNRGILLGVAGIP